MIARKEERDVSEHMNIKPSEKEEREGGRCSMHLCSEHPTLGRTLLI